MILLIFINIEKEIRHGAEAADIVVVKQEGERDARRILDDPIRPFKIERCNYLNNNIYCVYYIHLNIYLLYCLFVCVSFPWYKCYGVALYPLHFEPSEPQVGMNCNKSLS